VRRWPVVAVLDLRMRANHPRHQRPDNLTGPGLASFQMHMDLPVQFSESFDQIGFAGRELPVKRGRPAVIERYLLKFTRPKGRLRRKICSCRGAPFLNQSGIGTAVLSGRSRDFCRE
jgi:hypothetical protein